MLKVSPHEFAAFELEVCNEIARCGWIVERIGMRSYSDPVKTFLGRSENLTRHEPDLLAAHASGAHCYLEVKGTTTNHRWSSNFTIEKMSLEACIRKNVVAPTFIVWHDHTTNTPADVRQSGVKQGPYRGFGSGDDYWLVNRAQLQPSAMSIRQRLYQVRNDYRARVHK